MATAAQVVEAALKRILVLGAEAEIQSSEAQDALFALNNMMTSWDAEGISLGFTEVSDLGDEVTVPPGALRAIIANLAIEIAPDYGGKVSAALGAVAKMSMDAVRKLGQYMPQTEYPSTLPRGSGNQYDEYSSFFYPDLEAEILAETTGAIGLETGTVDAS